LEVLQSAGFAVSIPGNHLCCGRPLYDFGFLDEAKRYLQRILDDVGPELDAGVPIVILEPSCASVFRDELMNLLPDNPRAEKLRRLSWTFSEFLERQVPPYQPPKLSGQVLLHGHCHHKAVLKISDEVSLLQKMGVDLQVPDTGCCGMAGPFGFEKEKYAVSQAVGERVLLPAVRKASAQTLIVADGFSRQEQIVQATGRQAMHIAEAIQLALRESRSS